jgi:hypothetical protein
MAMSEAKTQPTRASVPKFIQSQADPVRRQDCQDLVAMMRAATGAEPVMWGEAIVGFGRYRYRYASGHEGEWPIIGFSPRKNDLTVYLMPGFDQQQALLTMLGKHRTGKSCLYLKRLDQVDRDVLRQMIDNSVAAMTDQRVD